MFSQRKTGWFRAAVLILAIFAMLGVSLASTSAEHFHARPSSQCDICVTAHVVSLEAVAVFHLVGAVEIYERLAPPAVVPGYYLVLISATSSRGPPSLA